MEPTAKEHPPPSAAAAGRGVRVNLSLLVYKVYNVAFWGSLGCFLQYSSLYFKQLGFSPAYIGLVSGFRPLVGFVLLPFIAAAADRFRCRRLVLLGSFPLSASILCGLAFLPLAAEVPCDIMEKQIEEFVHLNISLPYIPTPSGQTDDLMMMIDYVVTQRRNDRDGPDFAPPGKFPDDVAVSSELRRPVRTSDGSAAASRADQFPRDIREVLFANQQWLYEQEGVARLFVIVLVLLSFYEAILFSSVCQADIATLDALRREHGHVDHYGWTRVFGTLGWGTSSLAIGGMLYSSRTVKVSCGIEHIISSYWAAFVAAAGIMVVALITTFYFGQFTYEDGKTTRETSSWGCLKTVLFNWHYGSVVVLLVFLGMCNSCIWGFLFWHLENLGATQVLLGLLIGIQSLSEFFIGFFSGWSIAKFGHVAMLTLGILSFVIRFVVYAVITAPEMLIFIELFHGLSFIMTWTTAVSFFNEAIPPEVSGTMHGVIIALFHGLGGGLGFFSGGLLVTRYGAPGTFFIFAGLCGATLFLFLIIQWLSMVPSLPWIRHSDPQPSLLQEDEGDGEPDEDGDEPDRSEAKQRPAEVKGRIDLKLPAFTYQTTLVNQQQPCQ